MGTLTKEELLQNPLVKEIAIEFAGLIVDKPQREFILASETYDNWKETFIENPNYQILSFKRTNLPTKSVGRSGDIFQLINGEYKNGYSYKVSLYEMLYKGESVESGHFVIHSINRNSDNAKFKIGDKIYSSYSNTNGTIKSFNFSDCEFGLYCKLVENKMEPSVATIKHYEKDFLFDVVDGKIFTNDVVYTVDIKYLDGIRELIWKDKDHFTNFSLDTSCFKYFKFKYNAEKYLYSNKKCFSINDLVNEKLVNLSEADIAEFIEKVKNKD